MKEQRLRNGASTDRARPYRDALWFVLNKKFKMTHRSLEVFFNTSRTTVQKAISDCKGDPERQSAIAVVLARMNRLGVGL